MKYGNILLLSISQRLSSCSELSLKFVINMFPTQDSFFVLRFTFLTFDESFGFSNCKLSVCKKNFSVDIK